MRFNKLSMLFLAGLIISTFASCTKSEEKAKDEMMTGIETETMGMSEVMEMESIDTLLDKYEELVKEYSDIAMKAKEGSAEEAAAELGALVEKSQDLINKITEMQADMTEEQSNRFRELTEKIGASSI